MHMQKILIAYSNIKSIHFHLDNCRHNIDNRSHCNRSTLLLSGWGKTSTSLSRGETEFGGKNDNRRTISRTGELLKINIQWKQKMILKGNCFQERLLLSVLPEHVAVKMRQDLGSTDSEQFKKIYMSRHENVRYDCECFCFDCILKRCWRQVDGGWGDHDDSTECTIDSIVMLTFNVWKRQTIIYLFVFYFECKHNLSELYFPSAPKPPPAILLRISSVSHRSHLIPVYCMQTLSDSPRSHPPTVHRIWWKY